MAEEHDNPPWTQSDAISEVFAAESCHIVCSPPDYVRKVSRYLESSAGQSQQDKVSNGPADTDSDSGDSLFLTQQPVPGAVRSARRRLRCSSSLDHTSYKDQAESESDASSSSSHGKPKTDQKSRWKKYSLPNYSFPFFSGRDGKQRRTQFSGRQNIGIHYSAMGGFFLCVREMLQHNQGGYNVGSSLPTVDMDGVVITPLSEEEEEEGSEDDDIKVVERKRFVAPSKAKGRHTWCSQVNEQRGRRAAARRQETSEGTRCSVLLHRKPAHSRGEPEGLHAAASVNVEVEETPNLSQDNTAGPHAAQTRDELELNERNCVENMSHDDDILRQEERDTPNSKQRKKRRKNKSAAENAGQEVDGNLESDARMEESAVSVSCNVENSGKKKKRSAEDDEDVGQLHADAVAEPLNDNAEIHKKKKKRKKEERIVQTEECEEEEATNRTLDLTATSTAQPEESGNCSGNTAASQETLESGYVKRKKHKKKQKSSSDVSNQDGEERVDVSFSNDAATCEESTEVSLKKKKKKKKTTHDRVDVSYTPEENEKVQEDSERKTNEDLEDPNTELETKKKKKKKSKICSENISENNVARSDDSVSVQKRKKKRTSSFLVADAEENDAQTHAEEQNCLSQSLHAHVWDAQKPGVSIGDYETAIAGNLVESNDGVRKKKKKRKRKLSVEQDGGEQDHKRDFGEPNKVCHSALPETTDPGVKRKKKHGGNESELVTPMERLESTADVGLPLTDEAVVLKKKKKKKKKCRDETSHDSSTSDQANKETLNMVQQASPSPETHGNQTLNDRKDKKKKKKLKFHDSVLLYGELLNQEDKKKRKKEKDEQAAVPSVTPSSPMLSDTSLPKSEMPSSQSIVKNKHKKVKRRLLNRDEEFLVDCEP